MVYPRMSLLCSCKRQTHHTSCVQASQTTNKPIGMGAHCSLLPFPQLHLKTQAATEANLRSCSRLHSSSWHPPRDTNNCDELKMLKRGNGHMQQLTALNQTRCTWAPSERCCSPVEVVLVGSVRYSQASLRYFRCIHWYGCR